MNERIQELIEQATIRKWRGDGTDSIPKEVFDKEKFAELIVRECATMTSNSRKMYWEDAAELAQEIREHFGIVDTNEDEEE